MRMRADTFRNRLKVCHRLQSVDGYPVRRKFTTSASDFLKHEESKTGGINMVETYMNAWGETAELEEKVNETIVTFEDGEVMTFKSSDSAVSKLYRMGYRE